MAWNDNKVPVHFGRYRVVPSLLGSKYGWFFHRELSEHANMSTRTLARLLKEEKAFLVIDKGEWEKLVAQYHEKPSKSPLVKRAEALAAELKKVEQELAASMKEAAGYAAKKDPKDAQRAAKVFERITQLQKRKAVLLKEVDAVKAEQKKQGQKVA